MSVNGLQQQYIPPTLDGLNVVEADQIYIDGTLVNLDDLVPYTNATKTVDLGIFPLKTSYLAAANEDVVNKERLDLTINNLAASIGANFVSKTTSSDQTMNGQLFSPTFQANLRLTVAAAGFSPNTYNARVERVDGDYVIEKDNAVDPIETILRYDISASKWIFPDGVASKVPIWDADKGLVSSGVDSIKITYLDNVSSDIQSQLNGKSSTTYVDNGLALKQNLAGGNTITGTQTYSDQTASRVSVFDASKNLVSSSTTTTQLSYLDATSSIQNQLDGKANSADLANYLPLSGGSMTGAINMASGSITDGLYVFAKPTNADYVQRWRSAINHYSGTLSNTYLFNGPAGTILISQNTTRSATNANLCLGQDLLGSCSVASVKSDGSAGFLPLYITGTPIILTGNVGVGTSTTNAPLQFSNDLVNRKLVLYDTLNNNHQYYGLGINANTLRYQVSDVGDNHVFFTGTSSTTSTELMRIQGNGNVGIGLSPSYKLDVAGDIRSSGIVYVQNGNSSKTIYGPNATWTSSLVVGAGTNDIAANKGQLIITNGNCHLDAGLGKDTFINFYQGAPTQGNNRGNVYFYGNQYYFYNGSIQVNTNATTANLFGGSVLQVVNQGTANSYAAAQLTASGGSCTWFMNSADRSADGGANTATLRNDVGDLRLQSASAVRGIYVGSGGLVSIGSSNSNSDGILNIWNRNGSITHFNWTDNGNYLRGAFLQIDSPVTISSSLSVGNGSVQARMGIKGGNTTGTWGNFSAWPSDANGLLISSVTTQNANTAGAFLGFNGGSTYLTSLAPSVSWLNMYFHAAGMFANYFGSQVSALTSSGWQNVSDEREKEDIQPIKTTSSLRRVLALEPKHYRRKYYDRGNPVPDHIKSQRCIGFIAQEVQKTNPHCVHEWVNENENDEIRFMMSYNDYIVHLVGAVQEQQKQIDVLTQHARLQEQAFLDYKAQTEERFNKLAALIASLK